MPIDVISRISRLLLGTVGGHAGFFLTWSHSTKDTFFMTSILVIYKIQMSMHQNSEDIYHDSVLR